jgi:hypothetical protein
MIFLTGGLKALHLPVESDYLDRLGMQRRLRVTRGIAFRHQC